MSWEGSTKLAIKIPAGNVYHLHMFLYLPIITFDTDMLINSFSLVAQIPDTNFEEESIQIFETLKKVKAKAALVRVGSIPLAELAKLKAYMLDSHSEG